MKRLIRSSCAFLVLISGIIFDGNYIFAAKRKHSLAINIDDAEYLRNVMGRVSYADVFYSELNKANPNFVVLNSNLNALIDTWAKTAYCGDIVYHSDDGYVYSDNHQDARQSFLDNLLFGSAEQCNVTNCVNNLLLLGADIHHQQFLGITPLLYAVEKGRVDVVNAFLAYAPHIIYDQTIHGDTAIIVAARKNNPRVLTALVSVFAQGGLLVAADAALQTVAAAWEACPLDVLTCCVKPFIDIINAQNDDGKTALMCAAQNNNYSMVLQLLMVGANKDLANNDKKTAMDLTTSDAVRQLLNTYNASKSLSTIS